MSSLINLCRRTPVSSIFLWLTPDDLICQRESIRRHEVKQEEISLHLRVHRLKVSQDEVGTDEEKCPQNYEIIPK